MAHQIPLDVTDEDIQYFRNRLAADLSPEAKEKYRKQVEMLEDAVVIYHGQGTGDIEWKN